jgi:hypothetical protein
MRTDPILEELYQIRAELMRKAGSADVFLPNVWSIKHKASVYSRRCGGKICLHSASKTHKHIDSPTPRAADGLWKV